MPIRLRVLPTGLTQGLLRIASASIRKVTINRYNIDAAAGRMSNAETTVITRTKANGKQPPARN